MSCHGCIVKNVGGRCEFFRLVISGKRPVAAKTIDAAEMAGGADGEDGAGAQSECRFRKRNLSLALAASGEGIANLCRMCCSSRIRASVLLAAED